MSDQISTSAKWGLGIAASVLTAAIVAFIFGGIEANKNLAVMATRMEAMEKAVAKLSTELEGRPRYDANQATAKEAAQAVTDAAQNKLVELLTAQAESMDKRLIGFEARLRKLEGRE